MSDLATELRKEAQTIFIGDENGKVATSDARDIIEWFAARIGMIAPKFTTVYVAHGDGGERGIGPAIGYFSDPIAAKEKSRKQGWYGGDGHVGEQKALFIGDEVYLLANPKPVDLDEHKAKADAQLRQRTLAALTPDQLRVLGLKS